MDNKTIMCCVVSLLLGMILLHMLKGVCGCNVVEGQMYYGGTCRMRPDYRKTRFDTRFLREGCESESVQNSSEMCISGDGEGGGGSGCQYCLLDEQGIPKTDTCVTGSSALDESLGNYYGGTCRMRPDYRKTRFDTRFLREGCESVQNSAEMCIAGDGEGGGGSGCQYCLLDEQGIPRTDTCVTGRSALDDPGRSTGSGTNDVTSSDAGVFATVSAPEMVTITLPPTISNDPER
jgi:hypothetical protein